MCVVRKIFKLSSNSTPPPPAKKLYVSPMTQVFCFSSALKAAFT